MTYAEKQAQEWATLIETRKFTSEVKLSMQALLEQALQSQREATLDRMNQYAIDNTGEPLPPEMQFIILHTEVQP